MPSCTVRRGFLTLRPCGEPAAGVCRACGRPACAAHLVGATGGASADTGAAHPVPDLTGGLCAECHAAQSNRDSSPPGTDDWSPTDSWQYDYRDRYYRESGYRPPSVASTRADRPETGGLRTGAMAGAGAAVATDGFQTGGTFDDLDREPFDATLAAADDLLGEDARPSLFDS